MVALVTPMNSDGELDWDALEQLVEFHIDGGTDAIVAMGTTGESATLNEKEHCAVIQRVIKCVAGRVPVTIRQLRRRLIFRKFFIMFRVEPRVICFQRPLGGSHL